MFHVQTSDSLTKIVCPVSRSGVLAIFIAVIETEPISMLLDSHFSAEVVYLLLALLVVTQAQPLFLIAYCIVSMYGLKQSPWEGIFVKCSAFIWMNSDALVTTCCNCCDIRFMW